MMPQEVIEEMSFAPGTPDRQEFDSASLASSSTASTPPHLRPSAPPPAGAPPELPFTNGNEVPSYQKEYVDYFGNNNSSNTNERSSRALPHPVVTHYEPRGSSANRPSSVRGDASIRPNTGMHNAADDQAESLAEILWKMRLCNLTCSGLSLLLEIPDFFTNVFALNPARAVLGLYLTFFCIVLIFYELHTPYISDILNDQFGLLQHPYGRTLYLLLLGGLSLGQTQILQGVVGVGFLVTAVLTSYAYFKYPEYRRLVDEQPDLAALARLRWQRRTALRTASWARPDDWRQSSSRVEEEAQQQRESLLQPSSL